MGKSELTFLALCGLAATVSVAEAGKDRIKFDYGGITFKVDRYDDGRNKPYMVSFKDDMVSSSYTFDEYGIVVEFEVGGEEYKVKYKNTGELKKVKRTTGTRTLAEDGDGQSDEYGDGTTVVSHRRLYYCEDCQETWEILKYVGVYTVCDLVGYGSPILSSAATSINTLCNTFGEATYTLSAYSVCYDECEECVAPLTIVLEWFQEGGLDLMVIEPFGGERVSYFNRQGVSSKNT